MPDDVSFLKRIRTLLAFRILFVTALLGSFLAFQIGFGIFPYPSNVFYIIVFLYAMSIVCVLLLGKVPALPLAYMQIVADSLSAVTLILLTGGIESWFSWVLMLVVLSSAMVISKRAAYVTATLISFLYAVFLDLQFYGIIPIPFYDSLMEKDFLYKIFSHIFGLYITAFLAGRLITRLERKDIDYQELASFNRAVVENTPSGLFTTDTEGNVKVFNRAAEAISGVDREHVAGGHISKLLPFLKELPSDERRGERTVLLGGKEKTIGYTITRLYDLGGNNAGFIGIFQDLTELKALAREIKHKERLAAVGELSAKIAHEIRNPLASLKGAMEMLHEGAIDQDQRERLMRIALGEMDRLNSTITDYLSFARPDTPSLEEFDLHRALRETVELLKMRDDSMVEVWAELDGALMVKADPRRMKEVFWNLGVNALQSMPEGGRLVVATRVEGAQAHISFTDSGKGIEDEDMERIFFPFYTTKRAGTGLGLSTAFRAVEDHGGRITVNSTLGKGSVFTVIIPIENVS